MLHLEGPKDAFETLTLFVRALLTPNTNEKNQISAAVRQGWQENFSGERSGTGQTWAQLRPYTIMERVKRGYPGAHPILVQSGHLRASLLTPGAPDSFEQMHADASGWTLVVGTNDPKAIKHELGEGRIPARPFIELSQTAQDGIAGAIGAMIAQIEARVLG